MLRPTVGSSLMIFASYAAFAQTAPMSFEAASLKPTTFQMTDGRMMRMMSGGPGSPDPGRFTYTNVTLKALVEQAYNLKEFQVEGPDWMDRDGYDLVATMAQGTTKEQAAQMLQTLLAERFKLVFHRETKPMPVYALVVGKNGSKMKEVEVPDAPREAPPAGGPMRMGKGPGVRMMMSPSGMKVTGYMTMTQLTDLLTRQLARPVLDQTELHKTYDVDITWMPDDRDAMKMAAMGSMLGGGPGPGGPGPDGPRNAPEPTQTLPQALDEKLGLKLEARKSSAEMFVIEHAEKAPVEN